MAYNGVVFAGGLGEINVALAASQVVLAPLLASIDLSLFGAFGLGSLRTNLQAQLTAAISASITFPDPTQFLRNILAALAALQANIAGLLAGGFIPIVQFQVLADLAASIGAQLAGLSALLDGLIAVKIPVVSLASIIAGHLSAGEVYTISFENIPMGAAGAAIAAQLSGPLSYTGVPTIFPADAVSGILLVTKNPAAWTGISFLMRVA